MRGEDGLAMKVASWLQVGCKMKERRPMGEYVSKIAVIRALLKDFKDERHTWYSASYAIDIMAKIVDEMPSADVIPVVHGKWIDKSGGIEGAWNYCSVCGERAIELYDYCPNCGARMDGDSNEID